jgi:hypothetical protein
MRVSGEGRVSPHPKKDEMRSLLSPTLSRWERELGTSFFDVPCSVFDIGYLSIHG